MEERHRRPDRELEAKIQNLQETTPCNGSHAFQLQCEERALRFALGEKVSLGDAVPGQCREC